MKSLRIIWDFYNNNRLASIFILVIYTLVIFYFTLTLGIYRNIVYATNTFLQISDKNIAYCCPTLDYYDKIQSDEDYIDKEICTIEEAAQKYSAYAPFVKTQKINITYNGNSMYGFLCDQFFIDNQQIKLSQGNWFSKNETADYYETVVCGSQFFKTKIGDIINIKLSQKSVKVKVVGKVDSPYMVPQFSNGGNTVSANGLYSTFTGFIFPKTDSFCSFLNDNQIYSRTFENFLAPCKENATENEIDDYMNFLNEKGQVNPYSKIIENSNKYAQLTIERKMPMPSFFLVIVTFSVISISVLFISKKLSEYAVYYLCGCSRRRSFVYMLCSTSIISVLGGLINIIFFSIYPILQSYGIYTINGVIIDNLSSVFIFCYVVVTVFLSTIIPFFIFRG